MKKLIILFCLITGIAKAQESQMQFFRPNDQRGINMFETTKKDTIAFNGLKVKVGGNFELTGTRPSLKQKPGLQAM
jgi:hypothetical protein